MAGGAWEGLAQATGRLPGLALNIAQLQQQGQHMRALEADSQQRLALEGRRMGLAEEAAGREKTAWEHSEKKRVEQETVENAFTPVSLVAPNLAKMPTLQKQFVEAAQSAGYKVNTTPDGEVYVQNKAIGHIKGLLQTNTDFMKMTVDNTLADLTNQSVALSQQIAQIQESGKGADEKTLGPLLEKQKAVKTQIASIIGVKEGVLAEVIKKQATPANPVSVAPGGTLVDPKDGRVVYTAPEDPNKTQSEEQLVRKSLKETLNREPTATEILNGLQKRKEAVAAAGQAKKDAGLDVPGLAQSVVDGNDAPVAIKGSMGNPLAAKVKSEVMKTYPKFNFSMADANYKWKQSATNQRTVNFAGGALPRLRMLDEQLKALPNVNINTINAVMRAALTEMGSPVYADFESNRNAIVQEINTALSGTSQSSDTRLNIELENLKSKRSPAQIAAAVKNLREALIARLDVDLSNLYPMEVVRGEKTMDQYKKELFSQYRGTNGREAFVLGRMGLGEAAPTPNKGGAPADDMSQFWKK